jgi:hypothetical protein
MIRASVTAVPELFYKEGFDVHVEEFLSYMSCGCRGKKVIA